MQKSLSKKDHLFRSQMESCQFPVSKFDHRAHLRLAYVYLVENGVDTAVDLMRETLFGLLKYTGVDPSEKYHDTLTKAWILAVNHFMQTTNSAGSANEFIELNPIMLDSKIMLTHYSAKVLFSDQARRSFVEPDLDPIPEYDV